MPEIFNKLNQISHNGNIHWNIG